jgi:DNA polymerase III subunit alpha
MAYLKANYFEVFMTILLSSVTGNEGLTQDYLNELKKHQVKVLPPDINLSTDQYLYMNDSIYMPLLAIKSIGRLTVHKIIEERSLQGSFKDYQDFKLRMKKDVNDRNLEMLIHSGALDIFGLNHQTMNYHKQIEDAGYEQYITDFKLKTTEDYSFFEKAQFEKEALGFNLMYNPINAHQDLIEKLNLKPLSNLNHQDEILTLAYIKNLKVIKTKQGKQMAFALLDDGASELEATLFTDAYLKYEVLLNQEVRIFRIKSNVYKNKKSNLIEEVRKING